jgi:hypothetical protein
MDKYLKAKIKDWIDHGSGFVPLFIELDDEFQARVVENLLMNHDISCSIKQTKRDGKKTFTIEAY